MNSLDRFIGFFSPVSGLQRVQARHAMGVMAKYQTADSTRVRDVPKSRGDADTSVGWAGGTIREQARFLDENHDIVTGILNTLVNNTVGPNGISVEPQPRDRNGDILADLAEEMEALYSDWSMRPEVTWEHDRASMERIIARSVFRDGEMFSQHVVGPRGMLDHGTIVPYSMELLEADLVPMGDTSPLSSNDVQGIVKNAWGRPVGYHVYHEHPGSSRAYNTKTKYVDAQIMQHVKLTNRIRQTRGVSILASVMTRLHDLKNYEEAERIAARISASVAFQIKKGSPDFYVPPEETGDGDQDARLFDIYPGVVFDNLRVGEEVSDVKSSRPSQLLQPFRDSMLRAVAAGSQAGFSSISRSYTGTYSAQRQELVEQFINYSTLTAMLVAKSFRPSRNMFITAAIGSGALKLPRSLDTLTLYDAEFRGPAMPWIDPTKEADANVTQVSAGFKSQSQVIRERNGNPRVTMAEIQREREDHEKRGLSFPSVAGGPADSPAADTPGSSDDTPNDDDDEGNTDGKKESASLRQVLV